MINILLKKPSHLNLSQLAKELFPILIILAGIVSVSIFSLEKASSPIEITGKPSYEASILTSLTCQ